MWAPPEDIPSITDFIEASHQRVAGLHKEKKYLASIVHRHAIASLKDRDYPPNNVIVIGPTGGGKTYLIKEMLDVSGLPFIEVNATQYSEVGYIGADLSTMFYGFFDKYCDQEMRPKQMTPHIERWGVVIFDELDKLRFIMNPKERQPQRALQAELLKILEGDYVGVRRGESGSQTPLWTRNILFIGVGAFEGLDSQMRHDRDLDVPNLYRQAQPIDIMRYGFMQELVGRFPSIVTFPPLDGQAMTEVLKHSIWPRYVQEAEDVGVKLTASDQALLSIAQVTINQNIGVRGFSKVIDELLRDSWPEAQSGDSIVITPTDVSTRRSTVVHAGAA